MRFACFSISRWGRGRAPPCVPWAGVGGAPNAGPSSSSVSISLETQPETLSRNCKCQVLKFSFSLALKMIALLAYNVSCLLKMDSQWWSSPGRSREGIATWAYAAEPADPLTCTHWLVCPGDWMKRDLSFLIPERATLLRPVGLIFVFSAALPELLMVAKREQYFCDLRTAPSPGSGSSGYLHSLCDHGSSCCSIACSRSPLGSVWCLPYNSVFYEFTSQETGS